MALIKVKTGGVDDTTNLGRRNLIINGAMQVWQRGTSFTGVNSLAYHTDRFQTYNSSNASGESTISKSTDAPDGFGNSYKLEVTTADSSLHVNAEYGLYYYFEGQDLQGLKKGTSDAKSLTASFWVKSSVTGTFIVELMDNDNSNRHINKSYTINAANTWEYKTITFEGDTVGALDNDNNNSFHINWWLGGGTGFTGGTLQTSWGTLNQANRATGQTNVHATVGNTWQITGVQLELGDTDTPFEHRSYGEELTLCQRYYYKISDNMPADAATDEVYFPFPCVARNTNALSCFVPFPVSMRIAPQSLEWTGTPGDYKWLKAGTYGVANTGSFSHGGGTSNQSARMDVSLSSAIFSSAGEAALLRSVNKDAYFAWSAEL
jgi:hypothetical protein